MGMNIGYLTCDRTKTGDEVYTPFYAVEPLLKYIPKDKIIWCPFDEEWSAYVQLFKENGLKVINSSLSKGEDFFAYEPEQWDILISNPPFSMKDKILERCYSFGKPFALLLPLPTMQGNKRFEFFKNGLEILAFDKRINYHATNLHEVKTGTAFASFIFAKIFFQRN